MKPETRQLKVVLFSGGRGSGALTRQLVANPGISLTVAINGYDDGASTGEVRRFLGDSLGPSDFRKNASRLAAELRSCSARAHRAARLAPAGGTTEADARRAFAAVAGDAQATVEEIQRVRSAHLRPRCRTRVGGRAAAICRSADRRPADSFNFSDCSLGNLVFAGVYLRAGTSVQPRRSTTTPRSSDCRRD